MPSEGRVDYHRSRLSTLCAEVERLKAEAAVMRELCEATSELGDGIHPHTAYMDGKRRWYLALDAYRAMKGEYDANHD